MSNEQSYEDVSISLKISPSFFIFPLKIDISEGDIICQYGFISKNIAIQSSEYNTLMESIRSSHVAAIPKFALGLDGTTFELTFTNGFNHSVFHWWVYCPKEWIKIEQFVRDLLGYVKNNLEYNSIEEEGRFKELFSRIESDLSSNVKNQ